MGRRIGIGLWAGGLTAGLLAGSVRAQEGDGLAAALALEQTLVRVIEQSEPSVVSIARVRQTRASLVHEPLNPFGLDLHRREQLRETARPGHPEFIPTEFGTGIVIAPPGNPNERMVLTNYHVVRGGPPVGDGEAESEYQLFVRFADRRGCEARIIAADPRSDLAVLRLDFNVLAVRPADLKPLKLAGDHRFRKGQFVLSLGNPYAIARDGAASASWGIISNISRRPAPAGPPLDEETRRRETIHHFGTLLQVDTRLDLGTSGGPLLNLKGELIGVTTSLAALEGYEKSVGYAVPLDAAALRIIEQLTQGHEVEYGFLGVEPTDALPEELRLQALDLRQTSAARALSVVAGSPADQAGLLSGDLILEVNGEPVLGRHDLMRHVGLLGPDVIAELRVWRERQRRELTLPVKLGKWPVYDDEGIIATRPRHPEWRGLSVDYPTGRQKHMQSPIRYQRAVVVTKAPAPPAPPAEILQAGDFISHVNRTPVQTPAEFYKAVEGLAGNVTLTLADGRRVIVPR